MAARFQKTIAHFDGALRIIAWGAHTYAWRNEVDPAFVGVHYQQSRRATFTGDLTPAEARALAAALTAAADEAESAAPTVEDPKAVQP